MDNLAPKMRSIPAVNEHGRVTGQNETDYEIDTQTGPIKARQAAGCLLKPMIGDWVLISIEETGAAYILCVLEQATPTEATLSFEQNVLIRSNKGRLGLAAPQGVDLVSAANLRLSSTGLDVTAAEGDLRIDRVSFWGSFFRGQVKLIKVLADSLESFCERFTRLAGQSHRYVEKTDHLHCGHMHHQADGLMHLQSEMTRMHANEDVHVNGERIHMG